MGLLKMSDENTHWIKQLKEGDPESFQEIWNAFFPRLVVHAGNRLREMRKREFDEEDIAISALKSMFRAVEANRIPILENSQDLFKILFTIANRKISTQGKRTFAKKRGPDLVRGDSVFGLTNGDGTRGLNDFGDDAESHEIVVAFQDEFEFRLQQIDDAITRQIVLLKLEGLTNQEIAEQIGRSERTVKRKLDLLEKKWMSDFGNP